MPRQMEFLTCLGCTLIGVPEDPLKGVREGPFIEIRECPLMGGPEGPLVGVFESLHKGIWEGHLY